MDSDHRVPLLGLLFAVLIDEMGALPRRFAKVGEILEPIQFWQADDRR